LPHLGVLLGDLDELAGQVCFELSGTPKREGAIVGQDAIAVLVDRGGVPRGNEDQPTEYVDDHADLLTNETSRRDASVREQGQQDPLRVLDQHTHSLEARPICATKEEPQSRAALRKPETAEERAS
jgi:hypothetical protein